MNPFLRGLLGLLLLFPACAFCSFNSLGLTINTFLGSLRSYTFIKPGDFVGFENYARAFGDPAFSASLGFTLLHVFVRMLVATIFPLLLVLVVNGLGKKSRLGVRLLFTLPLIFFAPALVVLASSGLRWMWNRSAPQVTFLLIDALGTLAVSCGVGLIVYLAALRHREGIEKGWKSVLGSLLTLWIVGQLAVAAYTLQSFTPLSMSLSLFTKSLANLLQRAMLVMNSGTALALSTVIFDLVALFGVIATLILILSRLQLEHLPSGESLALPGNKLLRFLGWVALVLGGFGIFLVIVLPFLISFAGAFSWVGETAAKAVSIPQVWINTFLPPLLVVFFIQLPVAYLGAFGIGAVRPLGKWSEWLLLLFSPWLFVTSLPVAVTKFLDLAEAKNLDTLLALVPPLLLSVPMLVVLTLFFKGQAAKWRQSLEEGDSVVRASFRQLVLPSLPLALFLAALSFLASTQDLFLSILVGVGPERYTASSAIMAFIGANNQFGAQKIITLIALPVLFILLMVFGALQIFYLDRLSLTREAVAKEQDERNSTDTPEGPVP
jgi:hypothetical protein